MSTARMFAAGPSSQRSLWQRATFAIVLLCLGSQHAIASFKPPVFDLDDTTFEHKTQASTGQTTGQWAVLFASKDEHSDLLALWDHLSKDEEQTKIFGQVDPSANPKLLKRFSLKAPAVLLFKDRQVYRYKGSLADSEVLTNFLDEGHLLQGGEPVPPPPSFIEELNEKYPHLQGYGAAGLAVLVVVMAVVMHLLRAPRAHQE